MTQVTPFLTFQGAAALAIKLYTEAFLDGRVLADERHGEGELAGQVRLARISIGGQEVMISDSPPVHDWTFTPANSLYVRCDSEEDLHRLHDALGRGGRDLMAPDDYGFSQLFCWFNDRLGVSWQLNVERETP